MAEFSWSDSVKAAFSPCLSCLNFASRSHHNERPSSQNSSRPDLDRLLQDVDTDTEAETLSLHSNIGGSRRKKKRRGSPKNITLFGYNLFGKPPIRLDGDDDLTTATVLPVGGRGSSNIIKKSMSTSTLDSDAAPLDPSTIAQLSAARPPSPGIGEEELRRKEERRRRRREKKERKEALERVMGQADSEFEGFPGSGSGIPAPPSPREFVLVSPISPSEELVEDADLDAQAYNATRHLGSTRSESDSRSRTSTSMSNPDSSYYNHHHSSQQPVPIAAPSTQRQSSRDIPRKERKSSRQKGSSKSSSSKTSQSASIRSPVEPTFPPQPIIVKPEFEGFPNDGTFPSTGLSGGRMSRKNSEMGVFLARRGEN